MLRWPGYAGGSENAASRLLGFVGVRIAIDTHLMCDTAAYKRAGYAGDGDVARTTSARLLTNAHIRAAIDAGMAALRQRIEEETGVSKVNLVRA